MNFNLQMGSTCKEVGTIVRNPALDNDQAVKLADTAVSEGAKTLGILSVGALVVPLCLVALGGNKEAASIMFGLMSIVNLAKIGDNSLARAYLNGFKAGIARSGDIK